jgi:hypothetical protein
MRIGHRLFRPRQPDCPQKLASGVPGRTSPEPVLPHQQLGDVPSDAAHRVQAALRLLKDHADPSPAHLPKLNRPHLQDIAPLEQNLSAGDFARSVDQAKDRQR